MFFARYSNIKILLTGYGENNILWNGLKASLIHFKKNKLLEYFSEIYMQNIYDLNMLDNVSSPRFLSFSRHRSLSTVASKYIVINAIQIIFTISQCKMYADICACKYAHVSLGAYMQTHTLVYLVCVRVFVCSAVC